MDELLAQADTEATARLVRDLGFPIAVAVVLLCAVLGAIAAIASSLGYALYRAGLFLAPIVQKLAEGHFDTMETIKESSRQTAASVSQTATSIQAIAETQRAIQREMTEQRKLGEKVCDKMSEPSSPLVAIQANKVEVPQQ
jgi:hypothetical protein